MDYNVQVDPMSALNVFQRSDPTLVTLAVTVETALRRSWLPMLKESGPLGKLVARQAEAFAVEEPMWSHYGATCEGLPRDIINFLHDPLACAIALGWNEGVEIREVPVKSEIKNDWLHQSVDSAGKNTKVVTGVDGSKFGELWFRTVLG